MGRTKLIPNPGFGERIYRAMLAKVDADGMPWTAAELADCIGVTSKTVRAWIKKGTIPNGENLDELARCLAVTVEHLMKGSNPADKSDKSSASANDGGDPASTKGEIKEPQIAQSHGIGRAHPRTIGVPHTLTGETALRIVSHICGVLRDTRACPLDDVNPIIGAEEIDEDSQDIDDATEGPEQKEDEGD